MPTSRTNNIIFLLSGDLLVFFSALFITLTLRAGEIPSESYIAEHLAPFTALFFLWIVVFLIAGLYDTHVTLKRKSIPGLLFWVQFINILFAAAFFFTVSVGITPKTNLALYLLVSTSLLALWRLFIFPRLVTGSPIRAVIIGSGEEARLLTEVLRNSPYYTFVSVEVIDTSEYPDIDARQSELLTHIQEKDVNLVVGDMYDDRAEALTKLYYNLAFLHRDVRFVALHTFFEEMCNRIPPSIISRGWILEHATRTPHSLYPVLKRGLDILGALILLVPCVVIFPLVALAVKLHDGGAVFYRTKRTGQYNEPIDVVKFRTMTGMDDGATTLSSTHTITPLGRVLRSTRIDELPQLWNILRGDLSFIGPRPELPARAALYAEHVPYYNMRHLIKPGLSGWAQINNFEVPREEIDVTLTTEKLSFDLFYLKRRSLWLDIEITLKTIKTLLLRSGT